MYLWFLLPAVSLLRMIYLRLHFSSAYSPILFLMLCNRQATLHNQPDKRNVFLLMCVYVNVCLEAAGRVKSD